MLGTYYYHEIIRKTIIAFGTLFNNMIVKHQDANGTIVDEKRVPLAYGPAAKFIARLDQQPDLNKMVAITLPRMSFEMTSIAYDSTRKAGITQTFKAVGNDDKLKRVFLPVPYNIGFELSLLTKLNDDALQVVEQILPYFQPSFTVTIDLISSIGEKRDVPITLQNVTFQDDYEGDFSTRRALIYTFQFVAKTYLYGPITENPEGLIKKVIVDQYASTDTVNAKREMRYTVTPTATKDYNSDGKIDSADHDLIVPGDDFGFSENIEYLDDSRDRSPTKQSDI
tara:strand:- start:1286 stop:2131 length:846 start_codon:yes stop_codon:yes gene_type:complete